MSLDELHDSEPSQVTGKKKKKSGKEKSEKSSKDIPAAASPGTQATSDKALDEHAHASLSEHQANGVKKKKKKKETAKEPSSSTKSEKEDESKQRKPKKEKKREKREGGGLPSEATKDDEGLETPNPSIKAKSKKRARREEESDAAAKADRNEMQERKRKKRKAIPESDEEAKVEKKSRERANDILDPTTDGELTDQARKALSFAYAEGTPEWKFKKASQNWLVRNIWQEAIPDRHFPLILRYIKQMQGAARDNLAQTCLMVLNPPVSEQPAEVTPPDPAPASGPAPAPILKQASAGLPSNTPLPAKTGELATESKIARAKALLEILGQHE